MLDAVLKFKAEIETAAAAHGLKPELVAAVVEVESLGQAGAMRHEPLFRYTDPRAQRPAISSRDTDLVAQKISWGLMQVMGGTARTELGFAGWLPELCIPAVGLDLGCRYLARLIARFGETGGVSAYNQGLPRKNHDGRFKNQRYVDDVLAAKASYAAAFAVTLAPGRVTLTPDPSPVMTGEGSEENTETHTEGAPEIKLQKPKAKGHKPK